MANSGPNSADVGRLRPSFGDHSSASSTDLVPSSDFRARTRALSQVPRRSCVCVLECVSLCLCDLFDLCDDCDICDRCDAPRESRRGRLGYSDPRGGGSRIERGPPAGVGTTLSRSGWGLHDPAEVQGNPARAKGLVGDAVRPLGEGGAAGGESTHCLPVAARRPADLGLPTAARPPLGRSAPHPA